MFLVRQEYTQEYTINEAMMEHPVSGEAVLQDQMVTPYLSLWMDGPFLCSRYNKDLHLSLEVAKACVEARIFFSKGMSYPLLVDMRGIRTTTREARRYMATVGATLVTAGALITGSAVNRMLGNIFLKVDKPPVPVQLFTSEAKARAWLQEFV